MDRPMCALPGLPSARNLPRATTTPVRLQILSDWDATVRAEPTSALGQKQTLPRVRVMPPLVYHFCEITYCNRLTAKIPYLSAIGPKRTSPGALHMSAFGG